MPKNKYLLIALGIALGMFVVPMVTSALARKKSS